MGLRKRLNENENLIDELRVRTTTEAIVEFRKYAAGFDRYHDAFVELLKPHSEVLRKKEMRGEREFL